MGLAVQHELRAGDLVAHVAGFGFCNGPDGAVFVARGDLGEALHGDRVEVECWSAERGMQGRVTRVLARAPRRLCGTIERGLFVADDERITRALRCEVAPGVRVGRHSVVGGILQLAASGTEPEIVVVRSLGARGNARDEEDAMLWRESLDAPFDEDVQGEAARAAGADDDLAREDLRALDFVTIDPASAEDHDDAVHAERLPDGGVRVRVAIADVASFVVPGGAIDREALRRGTSIYLPHRVIPMLPHAISSDAASLRPGVDRRAVVLELELAADARVTRQQLRHATIRCGAKLTYEHAGAMLDAPARTAREQMIALLAETAEALRAQRRAEGALTVDAPEVRVDADADTGQPRAIARAVYDASTQRARELVEEMMLLANRGVASILHEARADVLFRGHAAPEARRLGRVVAMGEAHGVAIAASEGASALRSTIAALPAGPARDALGPALLAALPAAEYARGRESHFALATHEYVHFTSPIRRYADLVVHRALRALAEGGESAASVDPELVNETQRRGRALHREITAIHGAILMGERQGETFLGTVTRVTPRELWVALDEPAVSVRCPSGRDPIAEGGRVAVTITGASLASRRLDGRVAPQSRGSRVGPQAQGRRSSRCHPGVTSA